MKVTPVIIDGKQKFKVTHTAHGIEIEVVSENRNHAMQAVIDAIFHTHGRRTWRKKQGIIATHAGDLVAENQRITSAS